MKIYNFIEYLNPLGKKVTDYVIDSELSRLIKLGFVIPWDYRLQGTFFCPWVLPKDVTIEFVYSIRSFAFFDIL